MSDNPLDALEGAFDDDRGRKGYASWFAELDAAASEDALFETLARQRPPTSKLARQQLRGRLVKILSEKFKEFDSGSKPAGVADAWLREGDETSALQGRAFVADEVEPWASAVFGADVLDETSNLFGLYLHAPGEVLDTLALWSAYTHVFDPFGVSPIADLSSPTKRCGKTTAAIIARYLVRKPLMSSNLSPASLFRAVDAWQPTLLMDEADTFATSPMSFAGS